MSNDRKQDQGRQPVETIRDGAIKMSIWRNEGQDGPFFSTSVNRTYRDDEGQLRDTNSFTGADLLKVSELARQAYARTNDLRREEFKQQRANGREEVRSNQHKR